MERKLKTELTQEQRELAERIGDIGNKSSGYKSLGTLQAKKFIPTQEQH